MAFFSSLATRGSEQNFSKLIWAPLPFASVVTAFSFGTTKQMAYGWELQTKAFLGHWTETKSDVYVWMRTAERACSLFAGCPVGINNRDSIAAEFKFKLRASVWITTEVFELVGLCCCFRSKEQMAPSTPVISIHSACFFTDNKYRQYQTGSRLKTFQLPESSNDLLEQRCSIIGRSRSTS